MRGRFRPPMFLIVAALIVVMAVLATLQYRWLGRISDAERESRRSTLAARATAFASDFDKELTLAYVLFQLEPVLDPPGSPEDLASRLAVRYDRWQAASRFPKLIKDFFIASREHDGSARLQRFNTATKFIEPADWPAALEELRTQIVGAGDEASVESSKGSTTGKFVVRRMPPPLWDDVPALLVPMPLLLFSPGDGRSPVRPQAHLSYTVLVLDRDVIAREMLPALAQQHLRGLGDGVDYDVAVVSAAEARPVLSEREARVEGPIFTSASDFNPRPDAKVDAGADLFQVRTQDFPQIAADIRRLALSITAPAHTVTTLTKRTAPPSDRQSTEGQGVVFRGGAPLSVLLDQPGAVRDRAFATSVAGGLARAANSGPRWRLLVKHPSGSLEAAVDSTRRRNLLVSSSILAVLAASMTLLVMSARRSQEVARQQMEFVATVSHELRTPLAVIRSAGDNLAAGVVGDVTHIKKYGELVRSEGRRLSEMVEQILEFAGISSGQRRLEPRPVDVSMLLDEVLSASAALLEEARIEVEMDLPHDVPAILGDEAALRRVFQNLVGNAIKYGGEGRWLGIRVRRFDRVFHELSLTPPDEKRRWHTTAGFANRIFRAGIQVAVADRGRGIPPSEHVRIFEPFYRTADVVAAQIQGAGLGLSLVQRIVDAHGGRITVKSAPGEGSEFTVYLPAAGAEPVPGADPRAAEAPRYT